MIIDWIEFYKDAYKQGWKVKTIFNKIQEALVDTHGKEFSDMVITKLTGMIINDDD